MRISAALPILVLAGIALAQNPSAETAQSKAGPSAQAQGLPTIQFGVNSIIPVELAKSLDAKKAKIGEPVEAKIIKDMYAQGRIILPRGTKIIGHITNAKPHSKQSPASLIGISFDRVVMKDGQIVPMAAAIQAIGPPLSHFGNAEGPPTGPLGGGSTGGPMGNTPGAVTSSGVPASDDPSVRPVSPPDKFPSGSASAHPLNRESQGVVGLKGLELESSSQESVVSSDKKNVHLDGGTQMILRVQ